MQRRLYGTTLELLCSKARRRRESVCFTVLHPRFAILRLRWGFVWLLVKIAVILVFFLSFLLLLLFLPSYMFLPFFAGQYAVVKRKKKKKSLSNTEPFFFFFCVTRICSETFFLACVETCAFNRCACLDTKLDISHLAGPVRTQKLFINRCNKVQRIFLHFPDLKKKKKFFFWRNQERLALHPQTTA